MDINKQELIEIISATVRETVVQLGLGNPKPKIAEKTAYAKTEALLYNYNDFKRIINERMLEIDDLRKYGVPKKAKDITAYNATGGGMVKGIVLEEESVEDAVRKIEHSIASMQEAITLLDSCMSKLKSDPYYKILEYRYIEGRTQEDIAGILNCSQVTISKNKNRLVKELAMRLFPSQFASEMIQ